MKTLIIPIFVVYKGCPNRCVYCNERITAGLHPDRITRDRFRMIVDAHLAGTIRDYGKVQVAFYGGNFTGMNMEYQEELLQFAEEYIAGGVVDSVRISTRPDYIDEARLSLLNAHHVRTVEIGAQSLIDTVLERSRRGHSADQVRQAVSLLKAHGCETGIHLMAGLPGDSDEGFRYTVEETIRLEPDMVRIHPTVVLKDTALSISCQAGDYRPLSMEDAVGLCKYALVRFKQEGISVIRIGLQTTSDMEIEGNIVAGPHHPAFRSLVEGALFLDMTVHLLARGGLTEGTVEFIVSPRDESRFRGMRNGNIAFLRDRYPRLSISLAADPDLPGDSLVMNGPRGILSMVVSDLTIQA